MGDAVAPTPNGKVHPAAELFPMMSDEDLRAMAADIKANGLIRPIVLDDEGTLIDGRNRLAACALAEVEPTYEALNGHDPVAYIFSANVPLRPLTQGQKAMAAVLLRERYKLYQSTRQAARAIGVPQPRYVEANTVYAWAEEQCEGVMLGTVRLDAAVAAARKRKQEAEEAAANLARLRREAPDLAVLVEEERLGLAEAVARLEARERAEQEIRENATRGLVRGLTGLDAAIPTDVELVLDRWLPEMDHWERRSPDLAPLLTADGMRALAGRLGALADALDLRGGELP